MALDNAQFIAELSITDPPGTDPLSQGDDHIRTVKRATQQSFPNIDAAVTLTAAQMNLAAIKNEANEFTAEQIIQDASLRMRAVADVLPNISFQRGTFNRWTFQQDNDAGNNNFRFSRFDAGGILVDRPWTCDSTTGIIDFAQVPTVLGAPLWIAGEIRMFAATATPGTNWFLADGTNGTVNLTDRAVIASGASAAGTALNPNFVGTAAAGTTGSTAISAAQMPAHTHPMGATQGTSGGTVDTPHIEDQSFGAVAVDPTRTGEVIPQTAGSGSGHTHTSPAQAVTENGTSRDTVRSLSRVVEMHQYVP